MARARHDIGTTRGFSLIELLVVLGLITLLVGILVPALGAAKRHAQTIECATRMRQLAIVMDIYADGNDGFYPPRNGGDPAMMMLAPVAHTTGEDDVSLPPLDAARPSIWPVAVAANLRQVGVAMAHYERDEVGFLPGYVCPSDPDPTPPMSLHERYVPWYSSFVFNGFNDYRYPTRTSGWLPSDTTAMRRDEIKSPSAVALFGEKKSGRTFAKLHVDIYGQGDLHPVTILDQSRHQGGFSNVAFADASTRTFSPPGTLSPENLWATRDTNRYHWGRGE